MLQLVSGNIVALIASILMVASGCVKNRKKIIYIQKNPNLTVIGGDSDFCVCVYKEHCYSLHS